MTIDLLTLLTLVLVYIKAKNPLFGDWEFDGNEYECKNSESYKTRN